MSPRNLPPFRADHVGSLLRPSRLLEARKQKAEGAIGAEELRSVEDEAIREVVRMQGDVGLQSATDGEFRRSSWHMDFIYSLGGVGQTDGRITVRMHNADGDVEFTAPALQINGSHGTALPTNALPSASQVATAFSMQAVWLGTQIAVTPKVLTLNGGKHKIHLELAGYAPIDTERPAPASGRDILRSDAIADCLTRLPDAHRAAIHLHYWLGHTMEEIAQTLGIQSGTAKSWLFRARHLLARCLALKGVHS